MDERFCRLCLTTLAAICVGCSDDGSTTSDGAVPDASLADQGELWPCDTPGQPCNAHDPCAVSAVCGDDHLCRITQRQDCDDGLDCTRDICKGMGLCEHEPLPDTCLLTAGAGTDLACYNRDEPHPTDPCLVCKPDEDQETWYGVTGGGCDDGDDCTKDDYCQSGVCKGVDYSAECADELGCTEDLCDGKGGCVSNNLKSGWCLIDNVCVAAGTKDSTGCAECDPTKDKYAFSPLSGMCLISGACVKQGTQHPDGCAECKPTANPNGWTLTSATDCLIAGGCYAPGYTYGCGKCDPSQSQTAWTPIPGCTCTPVAAAAVDSTGDAGEYSSLAIDGAGKVHIGYYDRTYDALKYATNASGSWVTTTVDSSGDVGKHVSLGVDGNGVVHISYYDYDWSTEDLKYATNASGSWVTTTVDSTGDVGEYSSLAIDGAGKVHISYYDWTNEHLKHATNASGSWAVSTVDASGDMGWTNDIAARGNAVHISYYDYTNHDLKHATNASGSWVTTTLDSTGDVGEDSSVAVDKSGFVHISYYDWTNEDLKYATNASGSWVTTTLDSTGEVGSATAIAVDSGGKVHISYFDATNDDLKYATNVSGSWVTRTLDSTGSVGQDSSVAVDSADRVHVSYYDSSNGALNYLATCP